MTNQQIHRAAAGARTVGIRGKRLHAMRGSTVTDLIRRLTAEIVERRLLPGVRLEEAGLAERYGVSRTPVREALRQLEIMELVQRRPNRGVVVAAMQSERLDALFEALVELESICARLAALRMPPADKARLLQAHSSRGDGAPADLHGLIRSGAGNDELVSLVTSSRQRLAPYRQSRLGPDREMSSFEEHTRVVEAIAAGDADKAAQAMRDHLRVAGEVSWRFRY